jgi:Spy/CpxP family protein refolding chaperone
MKRFMKLLIAVSILGVSVPSAFARPMGGRHGQRPLLHRIIERRAAELGVEDATVTAIVKIAEAARANLEALRLDVWDARQTLDQSMEAEELDRDAILAQTEALCEARKALRLAEVGVQLEIRAQLTAEQWQALQAQLGPRRARRGPARVRGGYR